MFGDICILSAGHVTYVKDTRGMPCGPEEGHKAFGRISQKLHDIKKGRQLLGGAVHSGLPPKRPGSMGTPGIHLLRDLPRGLQRAERSPTGCTSNSVPSPELGDNPGAGAPSLRSN